MQTLARGRFRMENKEKTQINTKKQAGTMTRFTVLRPTSILSTVIQYQCDNAYERYVDRHHEVVDIVACSSCFQVWIIIMVCV